MDVPKILLDGHYSERELNLLKQTLPIWRNTDLLEAQIACLYDVRFPGSENQHDYIYKKIKFIKAHTSPNSQIIGNWIYFPWDRHLIHTVNRTQFYELMFRRNPVQVKSSEHKILLNSKIMIIGLQRGYDIALALAHSGIGKQFSLVDAALMDNWSISDNLWSHRHLGLSAMDATCQELFDINPYLEISTASTDIEFEFIQSFLQNKPSIQIIIDMESSPEAKLAIRSAAKVAKIPVFSILDEGNGAYCTVDRFDLSDSALFFEGKFGNTPEEIKENSHYPDSISVPFHTAKSMVLAGQVIHLISQSILKYPTQTTPVFTGNSTKGLKAQRPLMMKRAGSNSQLWAENAPSQSI